MSKSHAHTSPPCLRPCSQLWAKWYHRLPGIQGHSVQRKKGGWGIGRAIHIALEEKGKERKRGRDIGYQERKGALLKQVAKDSGGNGAGPRRGKSGEKRAHRPVKGYGAHPSSPLSCFHLGSSLFSLSGEAQVCNSVHVSESMCCKKRERGREWQRHLR